MLLDLRLPGCSGLDVLRDLKRRLPEAVVIVMTGFATVQSAVQAMKLGRLMTTSPSPLTSRSLKLELERVTNHLKLTAENRVLREQLKSKQGFGQLVGHCPEMEKLYRIISKAAHSTHPSDPGRGAGTGKELVARSIHYSGPYKDKPFIPVDCGSLVPTLIESELFGYVRGALHRRSAPEGRLAGDCRRRHGFPGRSWRTTHRPAVQAPAGDSGKGDPSGRRHPHHTNQRAHSGSHQSRSRYRRQPGNFRRDLYFRLNVLNPAHSAIA